MPRFMDFHQDLKLPAEAIEQIADDARHGRADQFGVLQVDLYHNADGRVYCLLDGLTSRPSVPITPRSGCPAATSTRSTASRAGPAPRIGW